MTRRWAAWCFVRDTALLVCAVYLIAWGDQPWGLLAGTIPVAAFLWFTRGAP